MTDENKQIEEMAFDVYNLDFCKHLEQEECDATTCCHCTAEALYNAGYRKERQGEWIDLYKGKYENKLYACSVCRKGAFLRVEADELNTPRTVQALTPYCPHCGARMKGGAE